MENKKIKSYAEELLEKRMTTATRWAAGEEIEFREYLPIEILEKGIVYSDKLYLDA